MSATLVGRVTEIDTLRAVLRSTGRGSGQAVVIEGQAGVGKTRLLAALVAHARDSGATVWYGAAEELAASRPFGVLAHAFAGEESAAVDLLREVAAGQSPPDHRNLQYRVTEDLLDHVEQVAATGPVVLALDDVQWADPATLLAALDLTRRFTRLPVLLAVALRPLPTSAALDRLRDSLHDLAAPEVRLGPLDPEAVAALLTDALGATPGPELLALVQRAGGNPFYLHELVRALQGSAAVTIHDGVAGVNQAGFPGTLGTTIQRQLRFLSEDALTLLQHAAVLGGACTAAELAAVSGRPPDQLLAPLQEVVRAEVLADRPDGLTFRHDLVREALYEQIPHGLRRELHAAAGRALAALGAAATRVASQYARGATAGDAAAITHLRAAAEQTRSSAPEIAVGFLRQAIELAGPAGPTASQLRTDLAGLLVATGRHAAAFELVEQVLAGPHDPDLAGVLWYLGGQALFMLRRSEAAAWLTRAAGASGLTDPERAMVLAEAAITRLFANEDVTSGGREAARAAELAQTTGESYPQAFALAAQSLAHQLRGEPAAAVAAADRAVALAKGAADPRNGRLWSPVRDPYLLRGWALLDADRLAEAEAAFRAGAEQSTARGVTGWSRYYHFCLGLRHVYGGAWEDGVAELEAGLALADALDSSGTLAAHALLALVALYRDDRAAATHLARSGRLLADHGPDIGQEWLVLARAVRAEADRQVDAAITHLVEAWESLSRVGVRAAYRVLGPPLVRLTVAADPQQARHVTEELEELAGREPVPSLQGAAARCRGLLDRDEAALQAAVSLLRAGPRPLPYAEACEEVATVAGDPVPPLTAAWHTYQELGAALPAARVAARLRQLGVRAGARGPRSRPTTGWDSLTPTERRIVDLAAAGLSNPEIGNRMFISRRTVQSHLSHVFAKLGVTSRTELASLHARRSPTG